MVYAGFGILFSDKAERWFGFVPEDKDREALGGFLRVRRLDGGGDLGGEGDG